MIKYALYPLALALCQTLWAADDQMQTDQSNAAVARASQAIQDPLSVLKTASWPSTITFTIRPEETAYIQDCRWVYPDKELNAALRERFKSLVNCQNVESLTFMGPLNLNDFFDYAVIDGQQTFLKDGGFSFKTLDEMIQEKPHLACLKTLKHLHIENLVNNNDMTAHGFFKNLIPMLPNLEELVCGGKRLSDTGSSDPLGRLGETLSGKNMKKVVLVGTDRKHVITLEKKWTYQLAATEDLDYFTRLLEDSVKRRLKDKD